MRLAIELLLSVLRSNKGGKITIAYYPASVVPWSVQLDNSVRGEGELPYQAAARCYDAWSKSQ